MVGVMRGFSVTQEFIWPYYTFKLSNMRDLYFFNIQSFTGLKIDFIVAYKGHTITNHGRSDILVREV